jgi:DNA-binding HxlR family transcriptional regulator
MSLCIPDQLRNLDHGSAVLYVAMMQQEQSPICEHFQRAAELIGRRWNPQVIRTLQSGLTRYSELQRAIPNISAEMLSARLKELEVEGILARTVEPSTPVRVTYALTERGRELSRVMIELGEWAERWTAQPA